MSKIKQHSWAQAPRGSFPANSMISGGAPQLPPLSSDYLVYYKYPRIFIKNNNLLEFDKVGAGSGSLNTINISYLEASGSLNCVPSVTGAGFSLVSPTTGFVLTSGVTASVVISGSPSSDPLTGWFSLSTNDPGSETFRCGLTQKIKSAISPYTTQIVSSGGYNIFHVVDTRTSGVICRWHTQYSHNFGTAGHTTNRCTTTATGYPVEGGYDLKYTYVNNTGASGLLDDPKVIWRMISPLSTFFYDFRYGGGTITSGTSSPTNWYDGPLYYYPHDADLPFFVFEPPNLSHRVVVALAAPYSEGYPYGKAGLRLHNYHISSPQTNDIANAEKQFTVTCLSRRSDDERNYIAPNDRAELYFFVRVQDKSEDIREALFPYRQYFKAAVSSGIHYNYNRSSAIAEFLYQVAGHPRYNFFTSAITNASVWTNVSGNINRLMLNASGVDNFYWIWKEDISNPTTAHPRYLLGETGKVRANPGSWCVVEQSATGMLLELNSTINITGYKFTPNDNKAGYPNNWRVDRDGWMKLSDHAVAHTYGSGWPRWLGWGFGGRSPADEAFSFTVWKNVLERQDIYQTAYTDINKAKSIGSPSGQDIYLGTYWGLASDPINDFEYPDPISSPISASGLMTMALEMDAMQAVNTRFIGLDASPKSTAPLNEALEDLKFKIQYSRNFATQGVFTENSRSDILLAHAPTYTDSVHVLKAGVVASSVMDTSRDLWASGFGPLMIQSIFDDNYIWFFGIRTDNITTVPSTLPVADRDLLTSKILTDAIASGFTPISFNGLVYPSSYIVPTGQPSGYHGDLPFMVTLSWPDYQNLIWSDNIESYRIYRSLNDIDYSLVGVSTTNTFQDTTIEPGNNYFYKMSNITHYGRESMLSPAAFISTTGEAGGLDGGTMIPNIGFNNLPDLGPDGSFLRVDTSQPDSLIFEIPCQNELRPSIEIESFSSSVGEVWTSQAINSGTLNLFYTFSDSPTSLSLIADATSETSTTLSPPTGSVSYTLPVTLQKNIPNTPVQLQLTAANACNSDVSSISIYWRQKPLYGASTGLVINSGLISALSYGSFTANGDSSFSANASTNSYIYFAFRQAAGTPKFRDRDTGLVGGFSLYGTFNFTNPYGYVETYSMYRSTYPGLGATNIEVTY